MEEQPVAWPQPAHRTTQMQNVLTQISVHRAEFEPMSPVFARTKTVHALDGAATLIGNGEILHITWKGQNSLSATQGAG
jgi:hypothetical protein